VTVHQWTFVFLRVGAWLLVAGLLGVIVWGGWDLVLIARGQLRGNSISQAAMRALYGWHPGVLILVAFFLGALVGILLGHFGWVLPAMRRDP
jgi:hypothetical protein